MRDFLALFLLSLIVASTWKQGALVYPPLIYLVIYLGALLLRLRRERERELFVNQLKSHRKELRSGGTVVVDNQLLKYDTPVTTYLLQVGGLISVVTIPSRYHRYPDQARAEGLVYSLCTVCSGWWHLPAGPLDTVAVILENLRGGTRKSVAELIDGKLLQRMASQDERIRREALARFRASLPPPRAGVESSLQELQLKQGLAVKAIDARRGNRAGKFRRLRDKALRKK
ncbi:MAG: hypothetical protein IT290_06990 [Deltaproteobacteria bacterium]|nr:hypothetical protein [Deltaproteobacteria bacterium]